MCWMTAESRQDGAALRRCLERVRKVGEPTSGGHAWGYAYLSDACETGEGRLICNWGTGAMPPSVEAKATETDADVALAHTRFATRGAQTLQNAHPFPIRDENGYTYAALCHNGTWYDAPTGFGDEHSDTYYLAKTVEEHFHEAGGVAALPPSAGGGDPDGPAFHDLLDPVLREIGETVLVLDRTGRVHTYAGRFTITMQRTEQGWTVASSGGRPVPKQALITDNDAAITARVRS